MRLLALAVGLAMLGAGVPSVKAAPKKPAKPAPKKPTPVDPPPAAPVEQPPWAKGVSDADQDKANALFAEGNVLFTQLAHQPALEKYKAAVALWDHPMIRFNMAVTLVRLDRMLEAADELERALRFGAAPFTAELYQQALDYQNLVGKQLGYVEIATDQPETHVLLDGKPWFVGPGKQKVRVPAGEHLLLAERKGYMTLSRRIVLAGGKTASETVSLLPIDTAVVYEYKTRRSIPWTITGIGGAITLGGLGMWLYGKSELDDFSKQFVAACPNGCENDLSQHPALADAQDAALLKGKIGVSMMIAGGAITLTGVIWTIKNRPIRKLPNLEVMPTNGGMAARTSWSF